MKYYPYCKPNNKPLYINRLSNHPPLILRQLTSAISRHLTDISHNADVFREAAPLYNNALRDSGFTKDAEYMESRKAKEPVAKRNRVRRITWFNPPYSKNTITRVGQKFLKLIDKHFPVGSKLHVHKVFNRSTIKVSYCTVVCPIWEVLLSNTVPVCVEQSKGGDNQPRRCTCRKPEQCPPNGRCLTSKIVYKPTVVTDGAQAPKVYIGWIKTPFKH